MRTLSAFLSAHPRLMRAFHILAALGVSAVLVWLFLRKVHFGQVWSTIRQIDLFALIPIAAVFMLSYWLQAVRWKHLVRHLRRVSTGEAFPRVLVSNTAGVVLPFQLGQVLMVQISAEKFQLSRTELFGAEFISRLMDGLVFAIFLTVALIALPIGSGFTALAAFMLFGTLTGLVLVWWLTHWHPHAFDESGGRVARTLRAWHARWLHPFIRGLSAIQDPRQALDIFLLSLGIWGTEAGFYWMAGLALGVHANPLAYLFLVSAANIGAGIPLAQAGIGFIFLAQQALMAVSVSREVATAYALSLQGLIVAPIVFLGPLAVWTMHLTWRDILPWSGNLQSPQPAAPPPPDAATPLPVAHSNSGGHARPG